MSKAKGVLPSVCGSIAFILVLALAPPGSAREDGDRDRHEHRDKHDPCADLHRGKARGFEKRCREAGGSSGIAKADYNGDGFADLAIGVPGEDTPATRPDAGAVIVVYGSATGLTTDPSVPAPQFWSQNASGVPQFSEAGDRFGTSVVGGDFNDDRFSDLAVGTPFEALAKNGKTNHGSVTVIYGSPIGLTTDPASRVLDAQLWAITDLDNFSGEVCIDKFAADTDADVPPTTVASFGSSLAWGDFDRDGVGDLAIGSPQEEMEVDPASTLRCRTAAGAVGVLFGTRDLGLTPLESRVFTQKSAGVLDVAQEGDMFGSVLAAGDFNGDLTSDLAIGVFNEDVTGGAAQNFAEIVDAGAVAVLFGTADVGLTSADDEFVTLPQLFPDAALVGGDRFGSSLAAGDFDGDARDELAIGAHNFDFGLSDTGAVFIRNFGTGTAQFWEQNRIFGSAFFNLEGSPAEAGDNFGWALAAGDFNADGRKDLAIGVPFEDVLVTQGATGFAHVTDAGEVDVIYGSPFGLSVTGRAPQQFQQNTGNIEDLVESGDQFGKSLTAWNFGRNETNGVRRVCVNNICVDLPVTVTAADLAIGVPGEDVGSRASAGAVNVVYGCFLCSPGGLTSANDQLWTQGATGVGASEANDNFGAALY